MSVPWLRRALEEHSFNLVHNPALAHWHAATASAILGCALAAVRGTIVAVMQPPAGRWPAFVGITRGVTPLYVIPFVLVSQYDCYQTAWERRGAGPRPRAFDASDESMHLG